MDKNKKKTLIVVDMQNDFIDGALGTKEAAAIVVQVPAKNRGEGRAERWVRLVTVGSRRRSCG